MRFIEQKACIDIQHGPLKSHQDPRTVQTSADEWFIRFSTEQESKSTVL